MNQKKIGQFIAALRKGKNMTQRNIAEQLNVSEKTVSKWECGNGLPEGIGKNFFVYRTPEKTLSSYENSLKIAIENGDARCERDIRRNMEVLKKFSEYHFEYSKFTSGNTHGDYQVSQIIWNEKQIAGVIDWTCACTHPYIWEVVRSYVFMAPECKNGDINIEALVDYIKEYSLLLPLNQYDIENAGNLFYYFLAVCDFYGQYYQAHSRNRNIYLKQAQLSAKLLLWFERNLAKLNVRLSKMLSKTEIE